MNNLLFVRIESVKAYVMWIKKNKGASETEKNEWIFENAVKAIEWTWNMEKSENNINGYGHISYGMSRRVHKWITYIHYWISV